MDQEKDSQQISLCKLCRQFANDFINGGLRQSKVTPHGESWSDIIPHSRPEMKDDWGYGFPHHETFKALGESAKSCGLCYLIYQDFPDGPNGELPLKLIPVEEYWRLVGPGTFVATFSNRQRNPRNRPYNALDHRFRFGRRRPFGPLASADGPVPGRKWLEGDLQRAIPDSTLSQEAFDTMRFWLKDCVDNHPDCAGKAATLPTRVIDLGSTLQEIPRLYTSNGEKKHYATLTHCWGGNIPCQTVTSNLEEYHRELPMSQLPQNFKDAIHVARELGLQYLWIDAICIIQDSETDWKAEAAKMAAIYRDSIVTLSPDFSVKSTEGFLKNRVTSQVIVNEDFAVRKYPPKFIDTMGSCVLSHRGWCMQERLLSRALLHFGKHQMYWECRILTSREDGRHKNICLSSEYRSVSPALTFAEIRRKFVGSAPKDGLKTWYQIVEEFSQRRLTYDKDKLPALAGAALQVRSTGLGGQYIAGHWMDGLVKWLFWLPADVDRVPMVKAGGWMGLANLTRPVERNLPSWSWASVDGAVSFTSPDDIVGSDDSELTLLGTDISVGFDDMMASECQGILRLRGLMARVVYKAGVGGTKYGGAIYPADGGEKAAANQSVMDLAVDREQTRNCWVIMSSKKLSRGLLLEETDGGVFRRIGYASNTYSMSSSDAEKFTLREIALA